MQCFDGVNNHRWHSGKDSELNSSSQGFKPLAEQKPRQGYNPPEEQTLHQGLVSPVEPLLCQDFQSTAVGSHHSYRPASVRHDHLHTVVRILGVRPLTYPTTISQKVEGSKPHMRIQDYLVSGAVIQSSNPRLRIGAH